MEGTGLTTGTCATAASLAAAELWVRQNTLPEAWVTLPRVQQEVCVPVLQSGLAENGAWATVVKPPNKDPDVTQGLHITVQLTPKPEWNTHRFLAGEGVGVITRPGLSFDVGEPAINPTPRKMILEALEPYALTPCAITVSVLNGEKIAQETFNPRLGIVGGISILGTTGIVRPYCRKAMQDAIKVNVHVIRAQQDSLVLVPGNIGAKAALLHFGFQDEQLVEVGNEWDTGLEAALTENFQSVLLIGHPGKLCKLAWGEFYTHSHHSQSALPFLHQLATQHHQPFDIHSTTAEGFFSSLSVNSLSQFVPLVCDQIKAGILNRYTIPNLVIHLIRMDGSLLL